MTKATETWAVRSNTDFTNLLRSAPPLAHLFDQLGAEKTRAIARTLSINLKAERGVTAELPAEAWMAVQTR